jgi:hypothetical protein
MAALAGDPQSAPGAVVGEECAGELHRNQSPYRLNA